MPSAVRQKLSRVTVMVVVAVLGGSALPATAAPADRQTRELEQRRQEIARKKAAAAGQIDVLRASDEKLEQALQALDANLRKQEAKAASARQAADVAATRSAALQREEAQTKARLGELRRQLRGVAVDAYVHGPSGGIDVALAARDLEEAGKRQQLLDAVSDRQAAVVDELREAEEDLAVQRREAESASATAAAREKDVAAKLGQLKASLAAQQRVAADVEDRLDARLSEAEGLAALDAQVAGQIRARQAALARLVAARPPAPRASRGTARSASAGGLVTVGGITVAASLGPGLGGLLDAAQADGLSFGGGGYRDPQGQVAVRRANCGSSNYDIYEKPSSQCRPPTAKPGSSMHEQGLAVDFTSGGSLVTSRSSAAYRWLAANAGRFGLSNLPEEPWHWSTTGG